MVKTWQPWNGGSLIDAVVAILSSGNATGSTSDEIAWSMDWPIDGDALQSELEELVAIGVLDRNGVGRGALYMVASPAHSATVLAAASKDVRGALSHRAS